MVQSHFFKLYYLQLNNCINKNATIPLPQQILIHLQIILMYYLVNQQHKVHHIKFLLLQSKVIILLLL